MSSKQAKSSKSRRRRLRKSKQGHTSNIAIESYVDKFLRFDHNAKYFSKVLLSGYIREIKEKIDCAVSIDIELLCNEYFGQRLETNNLDKKISEITKVIYEEATGKKVKENVTKKRCRYVWRTDREYLERLKNDRLKVLFCRLNLNELFYKLESYERRLILRIICIEKRSDNVGWPIHELIVSKCDNISIKEQLYWMEYVLWKKYKSIKKLDLSNMNLTDYHIVYICNIIENILKYYKQEIEKKNVIQNNKNIKDQPQIETHNKMKNKKIENIQMRMEELNLSLNTNITDKNIGLLLRTIKKSLPNLGALYLSSTNITNKVIAIIIKYNIRGLLVHLTDCKGVTLQALNKNMRGDYDDDIVQQYIYCKNLIYFANPDEYKYQQKLSKGGKYQSGKGKKYIANAKRNIHSTISGEQDHMQWYGGL